MRPVPVWLRWALLSLSVLFLWGLFATDASDPDFWWHLRTGQYVLEHHSLTVPDPFAFTTATQPPAPAAEQRVQYFNLTHEWLAQTLMYVVYSAAGIPGIILVRALLLTTLCGIAGWIVWRRSNNEYLGIATAFTVAPIAILFTADRPALATFAFVGVFMALLEFRREIRYALWLPVPLILFWANAHGGFFLGWIVLFAYSVEAWFKNAEDRKHLWIVSAVAILVSLLNPNGLRIVETLVYFRQSAMANSLVEWQRPYLWGPPYVFDILLYAAAAVLLLSWRKVRISDWILFVAFAGAALTAFRNTILIGFLAPILIASYFPVRISIPRNVLAWGAPLLVLGGLITGIARGEFFQLHTSGQMPVGAADYLAAHPRPGALLNTYEFGGYLLWRLAPKEKVFVDGRALSESVFKDYQTLLYNDQAHANQLNGERAKLLDRYNIQTVVMNTFEYVTGIMYPLAPALGSPSSSEWQLVYDDPQALIFQKNPPPGTQVYPDKPVRVAQHLTNECNAHIERFPDQARCALILADLWLRSNDKARARSFLGLYLAHTPVHDPSAEQTYQQLLQAEMNEKPQTR